MLLTEKTPDCVCLVCLSVCFLLLLLGCQLTEARDSAVSRAPGAMLVVIMGTQKIVLERMNVLFQ